VKAVYVQDDGTTAVSSDLRAGEKQPAQANSIYPVHAALGLSVSDILLIGAQPVIVEGQSDQLYLSAMKILLIAAGKITPPKELLFMPGGGVRGMKAVASIVTGKEEDLPMVLLDADEAGRGLAKNLRETLYAANAERVIDISTFSGFTDAEIEDLIPPDIMKQAISRMVRGPDDDFSDVYQAGKPIIGQVEDYAKRHGLALAPGWKVDLARQVKGRLLKAGPAPVPANVLDLWKAMFLALTGEAASAIAGES
jgi:hypothetical protein